MKTIELRRVDYSRGLGAQRDTKRVKYSVVRYCASYGRGNMTEILRKMQPHGGGHIVYSASYVCADLTEIPLIIKHGSGHVVQRSYQVMKMKSVKINRSVF